MAPNSPQSERTNSVASTASKTTFPADWTASDQIIAKDVLFLRHKLQKLILTRGKSVEAKDMPMVNTYLERLDKDYLGVEYKIIVITKINKVAKGILNQPSIPRDAEFKIKERCRKLLAHWTRTIEKDAAAKKAKEMKKVDAALKKTKRREAISKLQEGFRSMERLFVTALEEMQCDHSESDSDEADSEETTTMKEQLREQEEQIQRLHERIEGLCQSSNDNGVLMRDFIEEQNRANGNTSGTRFPFRAASHTQEHNASSMVNASKGTTFVLPRAVASSRAIFKAPNLIGRLPVQSTILGRPEAERSCSVCREVQPTEGMWDAFQQHNETLYCTPCYDVMRAERCDPNPYPSSARGPQSDHCAICRRKESKSGWRPALVNRRVKPNKQYCLDCFLQKAGEETPLLSSDSESELSTPPGSDAEAHAAWTKKRKRGFQQSPSATNAHAQADSDDGSPILPKRPAKQRIFEEIDRNASDSNDEIPIKRRTTRRSLSQRQSRSRSDDNQQSEEDEENDHGAAFGTKRLSNAERMEHNEQKWHDEVLADPETSKKWLGMSPMTFFDIEAQLVHKGSLRGSQGISATERLAIFLNLMTTGDTVLEVARRWSPEGTHEGKTIIDVGMNVVDCLMRLAVNVVPYTQGRKAKQATPRIPKSLNGDKEVWDKFNWCMGGIVHFCEPKRRATPDGIESTSRVIIADYEGMFKSVKVQWEDHAASSFSLANPPKGFVMTRFWKSFIVSDKVYRHITDIDGFVRWDECSTVADGPRMSLETFTRLHAKALEPSQRTIGALKERLLRSPQGTNDTALARKVLNDHPDLVPACCVVYNMMANNGEFDPLAAMLDQQWNKEDEESADEYGGIHNQINAQKRHSPPEPPSESELGLADEDGNAPSQAQAYSSKPSNLRPAERRAINDRMIKSILNNPSECMKWFGISKVSFMKVLQNLIAAGLPESTAMSKMERLALFLNLTTTGDPVLKVARRFGPRMCATVGLACNAVVQALMSLIDEVMPYTVGREHNAKRLPMPDSLEGREQIWEYFHDCLGSLVTVCAPTALRGSGIYKSTSRAIVAGWDGKFRSVEVQFKNTVAESDAERLGEGNLVADATKTFVISNFWKKAPDVDGFVDVNEGPSVDNDDIADREYKALYAKACQICNKSAKMLRKRFLRAPDSRSDKTLARKALKKLPELHTSLCILFNMLVDIGELNPHHHVEGYQSRDSDEDDSSSMDGNDEDDGGGDADETAEDNGMDVTQYTDDEEEDGDVEDQIMAEAGAEAEPQAAAAEEDADIKPDPEPVADAPRSRTVDGTKVKREFRYEILGGVKHEVIENDDDDDDLYN